MRSSADGVRGSPASFSSCTRPNAADSSDGSKFHPASSKMKRLSYSRSPSIVEKNRVSTPFVDPNNWGSERRPHRRSKRQRSTNASSSRHTIPPVPAPVMMCESANEVTEMSDRSPVGEPRNVEPRASHESSTTRRPWTSAMARMRSQSGTLPMRFGTSTARVAGVIAASMASTSMLNVSGSTSTNDGTAPARTIGATSVENVTAAVTTSSPGWRSSSSTAR